MSETVVAAARFAARAELGWRDHAGKLRAVAFTPLVIDATVVAALPFDLTATAQNLAGATDAMLVLSDSRMALRGWSSWAQRVRPDVTADRDGDWTWTGALDQEVRKHPPSRLLIDTAIQRREHWWYVPRWLVRLRPVGAAIAVARRAGPDDAVVFEVTDSGMRADTVAVDDWEAADVGLTPLRHTTHVDSAAVPALAFTHDFSIPDMEHRSSLEVLGTRHGNRLSVTVRRGSATLEQPAGLLRRLSRHWRRERDCRRALASYDAGSPLAAT